MSTFEEAQQFLKKESAGTNLYDHLAEVVLKLVTEKPQDPLALFETVSASVKDTTFAVKDEIEGDSLPGQGEAPEEKTAQISWSESTAALFKEPEDFNAAEQKVQDWSADANLLEWGGVSFGAQETYRLSLSLKHLAAAAKASDLRLWGKISGTKSDYYIAEGNTEDYVEVDGELDEKAKQKAVDYYNCKKVGAEGYRIGANAHTYWVCSHAGGEWTKLPDVTCDQIVVSRMLRKVFTGDLEAAVYGYPPFPGVEKNYLRAVIARISSDTVIAPDGVFVADEEAEEEAESPAGLMIMGNEEMDSEPRPVEEVADPSTWVHMELGLNKIGRATPFPVEEGEDEPEENPDAELAGAGLRVVGEEEGFEEVYKQKVCSQFAVIKNLKWPGAVTAANQRSYVNIYVGTGVEFASKNYTPQLPQTVQTEWKPNDEELPGEDEPQYCSAVLKFHPEDQIQFDPHKNEEVDDE